MIDKKNFRIGWDKGSSAPPIGVDILPAYVEDFQIRRESAIEGDNSAALDQIARELGPNSALQAALISPYSATALGAKVFASEAHACSSVLDTSGLHN